MPTLTTISDVESTIEQSLEALRTAPLAERITNAFPFIVPDGYRVRVQLEEDGRKKRNTAAATNWQPETGEVVLYFERITSVAKPAEHFAPPPPLSAPSASATQPDAFEASAEQIDQCCACLAEAESAGKAFISFKWFRDEALPKLQLGWTDNAEDRQRVLAKAVESGRILTSRIPNPKSPLHPTTTVALNRTAMPPRTSRFNPVPVRGEPVSVSLMRDRDRF